MNTNDATLFVRSFHLVTFRAPSQEQDPAHRLVAAQWCRHSSGPNRWRGRELVGERSLAFSSISHCLRCQEGPSLAVPYRQCWAARQWSVCGHAKSTFQAQLIAAISRRTLPQSPDLLCSRPPCVDQLKSATIVCEPGRDAQDLASSERKLKKLSSSASLDRTEDRLRSRRCICPERQV